MNQWIRKIFNVSYFDLYSDYEEYHNHVETGRPVRAVEISDWIEKDSTVLDVGCGDGKNALIIKERCKATIVGCDIVDKAGSVLPVIKLDLNKGLSLEDQYDYVILCEVIAHLVKPHEILVSAARIARKGVIVSIPNSGYIYFRLELLFGFFPRQSFTHIHFWTLEDFKIFCKQIGLNIVKIKFNRSKGIKKLLKNILPNLFAYQLYFYISPLHQ